MFAALLLAVSVCIKGGRALLVVPASVVYNWLDEFLK
jgi:SNF2 family DNA or RNA helicase